MIMNKQDFLTRSGLQVQTLEFWLEQRWLIPEETSA
jgi:chaperone modulatory protein CbpM